MKNKKPMQVLVVLLSLTFISTVVYAKSGESDSKKYSNSWWHLPYYQIKKATKQINDLRKMVSNLQHTTSRLEIKKNKLENHIAILEEEINELSDRKDTIMSQNLNNDGEKNNVKKLSILCPGCDFIMSNEFAGFDFSGAYLKAALFSAAVLQGTNFSGSILREAYFVKADLQNADFSGADLTDAWFAGANLEGSILDGAVLNGVVWNYNGYGETICPDGTAADTVGNTCINNLK